MIYKISRISTSRINLNCKPPWFGTTAAVAPPHTRATLATTPLLLRHPFPDCGTTPPVTPPQL